MRTYCIHLAITEEEKSRTETFLKLKNDTFIPEFWIENTKI